MPPVYGGGDMIETVTLEQTTFANPPLRFEAGTPMIGSVMGLKAALEWMEEIGLEKISEHETDLRVYLESKLLARPSLVGLQILGTAPHKGPLCTFSIKGVHSLDLASWLDLKQIAIRSGHLCAQPALLKFGLTAAARISFGVYNTAEEVDVVCEELEKFCHVALGKAKN